MFKHEELENKGIIYDIKILFVTSGIDDFHRGPYSYGRMQSLRIGGYLQKELNIPKDTVIFTPTPCEEYGYNAAGIIGGKLDLEKCVIDPLLNLRQGSEGIDLLFLKVLKSNFELYKGSRFVIVVSYASYIESALETFAELFNLKTSFKGSGPGSINLFDPKEKRIESLFTQEVQGKEICLS